MPNYRVLLAACALSIVALRGAAGEPSRTLIPMFENAQVRVWKTVLQPGERIGMHRHEHGRVVVALKGGRSWRPARPTGWTPIRPASYTAT
ncbi:MAG: hypothetical protein ACJ8F1_22620 [Polyangia bacterium]